MANPTTNYGFVLPTSSDLVTDLPADFDVALQGVDTRLKALQPGTTLGDLAYSSATANTNTRLGIGSTGQVLTVAGGVPTWATVAAATPTFVGCSAGGGTTLTNGSTTYSLAMTSENFDSDGFHDNSTNNTRFTIPTGKGGKYQVNFRIGYDNASGTPGFENAFVRVNGSGSFSYANTTTLTSTQNGSNVVANGSGILSLAAGDYIEVLARTDNGNGTVVATLLLTIGLLGA